jgi:hypothetical protein
MKLVLHEWEPFGAQLLKKVDTPRGIHSSLTYSVSSNLTTAESCRSTAPQARRQSNHNKHSVFQKMIVERLCAAFECRKSQTNFAYFGAHLPSGS